MTNTKNTPADDLRVVIIDDYAIVRTGLCSILRDAGICASCISHLSPDESLIFVHNHPWNLIILGAPLAGHSWLHLLKELAHTRPAAHVLVLSDLPGAKFEIAAMRAGASGYLQKVSATETIATAIRKTSEGGNFVSQDLIQALVEQLNAPKQKRPEELLSDREFQVLQGLAGGKSSKELAAELHLSSKTVSTYRARICMKLGVKSNAGIVKYALKHKLLS